MRKSIFPLALLCAALLACASPATTGMLIRDFGSFNGAKVELTEEGGIAALYSTRVVRHDDRSFAYAQRRICSRSCATPLDSASGALSPAAVDSLFSIVFAATPYELANDYGTTPNSADMVSYSLRVTTDQGVKTIRADDGTMPPQMRRIVEGVHGTISAARQ